MQLLSNYRKSEGGKKLGKFTPLRKVEVVEKLGKFTPPRKGGGDGNKYQSHPQEGCPLCLRSLKNIISSDWSLTTRV